MWNQSRPHPPCPRNRRVWLPGDIALVTIHTPCYRPRCLTYLKEWVYKLAGVLARSSRNSEWAVGGIVVVAALAGIGTPFVPASTPLLPSQQLRRMTSRKRPGIFNSRPLWLPLRHDRLWSALRPASLRLFPLSRCTALRTAIAPDKRVNSSGAIDETLPTPPSLACLSPRFVPWNKCRPDYRTRKKKKERRGRVKKKKARMTGGSSREVFKGCVRE